jgi:hypothetical protein
MRAFNRSELVVGFCRGCLANGLRRRNGNDEPAGPVLAQPAKVEIPWNHLTRRHDIDVA